VEAVTNPDEAFVVANGASGPANNLGEDFAFVDVAGVVDVVDVVDAVEAAAVAVLA
jgi:hypothetical protein